MWLASIALRDRRGDLIGTAEWSPRMWRYAEDTLRAEVLDGAGDESRERYFRMCITACLHRGVRDDEMAQLPAWWHAAPAVDIAGGPVEVLWSKGIPDLPSARPCENPTKNKVFRGRPDLWIPGDCGQCVPCIARQTVRACPTGEVVWDEQPAPVAVAAQALGGG